MIIIRIYVDDVDYDAGNLLKQYKYISGFYVRPKT